MYVYTLRSIIVSAVTPQSFSAYCMVNNLQLKLQSGITLVILILQPYFPIKCVVSDG